MKAVTTGPGISGTFADDLDTVISDFRKQTGSERWHLYVHALRTPEYSLRVYAPDGHTGLHTIKNTSEVAKGIQQLLWDEAELWKSRVRAGAALIADDPAARAM